MDNHVTEFCMDFMDAVPVLAHKTFCTILFSFICQFGLEDPAENSEGTMETGGRCLDGISVGGRAPFHPALDNDMKDK